MPKIKPELIVKLNSFLKTLVDIGQIFVDFEVTPLIVSDRNEIDYRRVIFKMCGYISNKKSHEILQEHLKPLGFSEVIDTDIPPYFVRHEFTPEKKTIEIRIFHKNGNTKNRLIVLISGSITLSQSEISEFRTFLNPYASLTEEQESGVLARWVTFGKITE